MSEIEARQLAVISTGHLTKEVADQLTTDGGMKARWCPCAPWTFGYFLYLDELMEEETPQCLHDICNWLREQGLAGWVLLDCDADEIEDLPKYEWE